MWNSQGSVSWIPDNYRKPLPEVIDDARQIALAVQQLELRNINELFHVCVIDTEAAFNLITYEGADFVFVEACN